MSPYTKTNKGAPIVSITKLFDAFKAAYDSIVRTASPWLVGLVVAALTKWLGVPLPEEVETFIALAVAFVFALIWYVILRVVEIVRGKASKLLGLGLVKSEPVYGLTQVTSADGEVKWMTRAEYRAYLEQRDREDDAANAARESEV